MKRNLRVLGMLGALLPVCALATEIRTPWISERGPIRYTFEKLNKDTYNLNFWTAGHYKYAHSAFLKQSFDSHPLTALMFNKSDFTLNEIFPNSKVPMDTEFYSPFLKLMKLHPRATYTEWGLVTGGRWEYPVWKDKDGGVKGRIGLRATVPFRSIEIEREDITDRTQSPLGDFVKSKVIKTTKTSVGSQFQNGDDADVVVTAYRSDFVAALDGADHQSIVTFPDPAVNPPGEGGIKIGGQQIGADITGADVNVTRQRPPAGADVANGLNVPIQQLSRVPAGFVTSINAPCNNSTPELYAWMSTGNPVAPLTRGSVNNQAASNFAQSIVQDSDHSGLDDNLAVEQGEVGVIDSQADYTDIDFDDCATMKAAQDMWLIFRRESDSNDPAKFARDIGGTRAGLGVNIADNIESLIRKYSENPLIFFAKHGYELETQERTGLGDIDLDLFYEHTFNKDWRGELFVGVRFPTGGGDNQYGNPYKVMLGNGGHWEVKLGGLLAWQPIKWMNMKIDALWSFVLENKEHRMAAFKCAQIKNFGPCADADVDWGYFEGHFDFNFFHPKTDDIRWTLGYEFYYKTEDHLTYKCACTGVQSWLGRKYQEVAPATVPPTYELVANPQPLSNDLAKKNTESMAHKVRFEASFQVSKYWELFAGGSYAFAGQNVMKDRDAHVGYNYRF